MGTWEEDRTRDPNYLSPHCASGACNFCRTRRERRRAQSIRDAIALAKPSTRFDYWNAPARPSPYTEFGPYPGDPKPSEGTPGRIIYLKTSRNTGHRLTPKRWRNPC